MGRKTIKRRAGKAYQRKGISSRPRRSNTSEAADAEHDGRLVTVGPLVLFSTGRRPCWLLDPVDSLAARVAQDGDPEDVHFEETDANFAIGWKGNHQIDGDAAQQSSSRSRNCPCDHYPRVSHPPTRSGGLIGKFQICLARICSVGRVSKRHNNEQ